MKPLKSSDYLWHISILVILRMFQQNGQDMMEGEESVDSDDEIIPGAQPCNRRISMIPNGSTKRGASKSASDAKKQKTQSEEEIQQQILTIDPEKKCCIWDFLEYYHQDLLVKEYVTKLLKIQMLPITPDSEEIDEWISEIPDFELPEIIQCEIINNFMFYFQSRYFKHNVQEAVKKDITLFNPTCRFNIPQFALLPLKTFEKMTDAKKSLVLCLQIESLEGTQFANELRFLKILFLISEFLETKSFDTEQKNLLLKSFFGAFYIKCRTEFLKAYSVKDINWDSKKGKLVHTLPKWRKSDDPIPPSSNNRYATDLINRVKAGKEKIAGQAAKTEFDQLSTLKSINQKQSTNFEHKKRPTTQEFSSSSKSKPDKRKIVKAKRQNSNQRNNSKPPNQNQPPPPINVQKAKDLIN